MSDINFLRAYSNKIKALHTNDSASASDWDQLENRMNQLDRNRKRRYVFFLILLALGFVLGGIYLYELKSGAYSQPDVSVTVVETIRKNTDEEQNLSTKPTANLKDSDRIEEYGKYDTFANIKCALGNTSNQKRKSTVKIIKNKKQNKEKQTYALENNMTFPTLENTKKHPNEVNFKEESLFDQPVINKLILADDGKKLSQVQSEIGSSTLNFYIKAVASLKSRDLQMIKQKNELNIVFPQAIASSVHRMKYFVKIDGGPLYTINSKPTDMPGPLVFASQEASKNMGFQNSLNFQLAPNDKWKFNLGINRSQLIHHGSHTASLTIMDGVCLNPNSNEPKEYAFSYVVTNGRTSSTVNLLLSEENPGSPLDSNDVFKIVMGMHKKTLNWAIPITIERKLYSLGELSIFAKGGIALGFASNSRDIVTHFSESCANLCFNHGFSPIVYSQKSNQLTTGIILGSSVEWKVSRKISLVFNPEMNINIKMSPVDHNSAKWGVNLGAMYKIQ
ncbi:MAG: hypothetical protein IPG18_00850 [Saprospiraceae bacterium]|nr:hypothetical protein [Saprospiraceae bacterium]MBK8372350.1 hypothetical protein [Saprospiraceae bacterium]MBK8854927.1 hypothetical protein [Saprospiraceae bacterium]MBK9566034.1 hypothetical protein [Saprospiraceae bacterium]